MSERDTDRGENQRLPAWLLESWVSSFQQSLAALDASGSAASLKIEAAPHDPSQWEQWQAPKWLAFSGDMAAGATLSMGCAEATARALTALLSGEAEPEADTIAETHRELLNQAASALAMAVSRQLGRTVQFSQAVESEHPAAADPGVAYQWEIAGNSYTLAVVVNQALADALAAPPAKLEHAAPAPRDEPAAAVEVDPGSATARADAAPAAARGDAGAAAGRFSMTAPQQRAPDPRSSVVLTLSGSAQQNLQMLMDVDLELSVSFGSTTLLLQDVLKLASGSIVELNRSAADPVEVLVNDSVIARGEVVVVEGNYGIRITEIVSQRERIRSLS